MRVSCLGSPDAEGKRRIRWTVEVADGRLRAVGDRTDALRSLGFARRSLMAQRGQLVMVGGAPRLLGALPAWEDVVRHLASLPAFRGRVVAGEGVSNMEGECLRDARGRFDERNRC